MGSVTSIDDLKETNESHHHQPVRPSRKKKSGSSDNSSPSKMSMSSSDHLSSSSSKKQNKKKQSSATTINKSSSFAKKSKNKRVNRDVNQWKKSDEDVSSASSTSSYNTDNEEGDDKLVTGKKTPYEKDSKIIASNGDIYTKVAMPRSKSFMKMNHNQNGNQYNLQDLFKELKDQVKKKFSITFHVFSMRTI